MVENDAMSVQSMTSLGRVGRILAGSIDPSTISMDREYFANTNTQQQQQQFQQQLQQQQQQQQYLQQQQQSSASLASTSNTFSNMKSASVPSSLTETNISKSLVLGMGGGGNINMVPFDENQIILQEPDVIASTKLAHSKTTDSITSSGPIAPPRRKKRESKKSSSSSSEQFYMNEGMRLPAADTDTDSDTKSVKSVRDVQQKLSDDLVKEIEKSWNETSSLPNPRMARFSLDGGGVGCSSITTSANMAMSLGGFNSISALGGNVSSSVCSSVHASSNTIVSASGTSLSQISTSKIRPVTTAAVGGSINRMSHSLGNSSTSVYSKPSPSNSAKSNSAPGRVRYEFFLLKINIVKKGLIFKKVL